MRLCVIANPESIHTRRWVRYFARRGDEVHLIGEHASTYTPPAGVVFYDLTRMTNVRKARYVAWALAVRRLVRKIRPDLLHAHQVASAGWLGAAAGWHPFMVTAWGSDLLLGVRRSRVHRLLARWVLGRADYVTCVSEGLAQQAKLLGSPCPRLEVVPWGVDRDVFHPGSPSEALRAQLNLGTGPVVLSLRAVRPVYNPLDIARSVPLILAQLPTVRFVIRTYSYDPALLGQFQALIRQAGAGESVRYIGDLPDDAAIAELYRLADVGVSVPSSDGTPQSVLEALACGVVPVLSDLPALREWVRHEKEGLFVPLGDVSALAKAVVRLLTDAHLRERLRANAVHLVQERADARMSRRRYEEIYERLARSVKP